MTACGSRTGFRNESSLVAVLAVSVWDFGGPIEGASEVCTPEIDLLARVDTLTSIGAVGWMAGRAKDLADLEAIRTLTDGAG